MQSFSGATRRQGANELAHNSLAPLLDGRFVSPSRELLQRLVVRVPLP